MIKRRGPLRWLFWPCFLLSTALHVGAARFLLPPGSETPGAVDRPTTAISVNLESSDVLDAPEESATMAAVAAVPVTAPEELKPDAEKPEETPLEQPKLNDAESQPSQTQPQPSERAAQPIEEQLRREFDMSAERERVAEEEALHQAAAEEAERQQAKRMETERKRAERRETERQDRLEREAAARAEERNEAGSRERNRSRQRHSAGASGSQGAQSSKGRVSASQGSLRNYAATVRAHIARNKPGGRVGQGTVVVTFTLSSSGGLMSASIISSSGNASLDQSALAALRRSSPFPAPPSGTASRELRFTMPFYFR